MRGFHAIVSLFHEQLSVLQPFKIGQIRGGNPKFSEDSAPKTEDSWVPQRFQWGEKG